jgi:hypothetical protein
MLVCFCSNQGTKSEQNSLWVTCTVPALHALQWTQHLPENLANMQLLTSVIGGSWEILSKELSFHMVKLLNLRKTPNCKEKLHFPLVDAVNETPSSIFPPRTSPIQSHDFWVPIDHNCPFFGEQFWNRHTAFPHKVACRQWLADSSGRSFTSRQRWSHLQHSQ